MLTGSDETEVRPEAMLLIRRIIFIFPSAPSRRQKPLHRKTEKQRNPRRITEKGDRRAAERGRSYSSDDREERDR